ncbi:MAG: hypothetical protein GXO74_07590 [Calditrichaeota bacterium]|nr:hypothetical protein [Calditrichota bacterium]
MKRKTIFFLIIGIIFIAISSPATAQSFFSNRGFGERIDYTSAQAIGLGGANIALPDGFQINSLNPATLVNITLSRLSGDFVHQSFWSKSNAGSGFSKYSNFNGVSLAFPLKTNRFVVAAGLTPFSQFDYSFNVSGAIDDYHYTKIVEGEGGLNKIHAGFGLSPIKNVSLGVYFNYYFGKMTKKWRVDYVSDLFWDTSDAISRKVWGSSFTFGANVNPISSLYLGAFFIPRHNLTFRDETQFGTIKGSFPNKLADYVSEEQKMTMPEMWAIGTSYTYRNKYRFVTSYLSDPWSKFDGSGIVAGELQDRFRISAGVEMLPSTNMLAKYHQKMTYRAGYFLQQLNYTDENGETVNEYGVSFGLGFPYYNGKGRVDLALQYGRRGELTTNTVKEQIFKVYISVIAGEKWFVRRNNNAE